jgi:hypothetical protein
MKEINGVINEAAKALPALPGNYCRRRPKVVVGVKVASLSATVLHRIVGDIAISTSLVGVAAAGSEIIMSGSTLMFAWPPIDNNY